MISLPELDDPEARFGFPVNCDRSLANSTTTMTALSIYMDRTSTQSSVRSCQSLYNTSMFGGITVANSISLQLPDRLYQRLVNTAQATQQPLEAIILRALEVGSPPDWEDVPEPFQADLAALDRWDDADLWTIALGRQSATLFTRYDQLLDRNREGQLTDAERVELTHLRTEADRFMLRKAQATALLRWRGISRMNFFSWGNLFYSVVNTLNKLLL